ncbi:hypothetical protein M758_4G125300 [Ceratodon purpureus]|nr:hypothetical protein M758_4G125300 [Ceratodon purpureus]
MQLKLMLYVTIVNLSALQCCDKGALKLKLTDTVLRRACNFESVHVFTNRRHS